MSKEEYEKLEKEWKEFYSFLSPFDRVPQKDWMNSTLKLWELDKERIERFQVTKDLKADRESESGQKAVLARKKEHLLTLFNKFSFQICFAIELSNWLCETVPSLFSSRFNAFQNVDELLKRLKLMEAGKNSAVDIENCLSQILSELKLTEGQRKATNDGKGKIAIQLKSLKRTYFTLYALVQNDFILDRKRLEVLFGRDELLTSITQVLLLEHVGRELSLKTSPNTVITIDKAQNELVLDESLRLCEKGHPLFNIGVGFTLSQLLATDIRVNIAAFLVFKINQLTPLSFTENRSLYKAIFEVVSPKAGGGNEENCLLECLRRLKRILKGDEDLKELGDQSGLVKILKKIDLKDLNEIVLEWSAGINNRLLMPFTYRWKKQSGSTLVVVGDSVAAGFLTPHDKRADRCVARIAEGLRASKDLKISVEVCNVSVVGQQTEGGVEVIDGVLKLRRFTLVVSNLLGNDIALGIKIDEIQGNIKRFIGKCEKEGIPASRIVWIIGIPNTKPFKNFLDDAEEVEKLRLMIEFLRKTKGIHVIEIEKKWLDKKYILEDGLHFTLEGQAGIAEQLGKALNGIIAEQMRIPLSADNLKMMLPRVEPRMPSGMCRHFLPAYSRASSDSIQMRGASVMVAANASVTVSRTIGALA